MGKLPVGGEGASGHWSGSFQKGTSQILAPPTGMVKSLLTRRGTCSPSPRPSPSEGERFTLAPVSERAISLRRGLRVPPLLGRARSKCPKGEMPCVSQEPPIAAPSLLQTGEAKSRHGVPDPQLHPSVHAGFPTEPRDGASQQPRARCLHVRFRLQARVLPTPRHPRRGDGVAVSGGVGLAVGSLQSLRHVPQ